MRQIGFRPLSVLVPVIVLWRHWVDDLGCVLCKLGLIVEVRSVEEVEVVFHVDR